MYHAAVCDCARIDGQCPGYQDEHSDPFGENARVETHKSFFEVQELQPGSDMSNPIAESTRLETDESYCDVSVPFPPDQLPVQLPAPLEESSLLEPSIGEVEVGQPIAVTYEILEEGMKRLSRN